MPFDVTILTNKIEGLKQAFENGRFSDALIGAMNTGSGLMQKRVFNANVDLTGQSFGGYIGAKSKQTDRAQVRALFGTASKIEKKRIKSSAASDLTSYQRKRAQKGRQVIKKDLQFTFGLRRSIKPFVENEKSVVLEFNNDEAAKVARGQENQITNIRNGQKGTTKGSGDKIFGFNESERKEVNEQGLELIKKILKS